MTVTQDYITQSFTEFFLTKILKKFFRVLFPVLFWVDNRDRDEEIENMIIMLVLEGVMFPLGKLKNWQR